MTDSTTSTTLAYYARCGASLFPIPAGQKNPVGIIGSFVSDCSKDPAQWSAWATANPGCNWGVVAGPSRLIIVDIDVKQGRDAAWAAWCDLCTMWGIPVAMPHVATPSSGWHVYFATNADPATLRQPDAIKGVINVRAGNGFTVAAGSSFNNAPYVLISDAPPHPAPAALIAHCTRAVRPNPGTSAPNLGTLDRGDIAALVKWLNEKNEFDNYAEWVSIGMALKVEFGDDGFDLWQIVTWPEAQDGAVAKWASFATDATANSVTLDTWLKRAHSLGWRGTIRKSTSVMFDGVAAIAAAAGASLSGQSPMPMVAGQAVLTDLATPILEEFLVATADAPTRPASPDYPALPEQSNGHGLYQLLQSCIGRIIAMAESPRNFRASRVVEALAVLSLVNQDTFDSVCRRIRTLGAPLTDARIRLAATALADKVERHFVDQGNWIMSVKGEIEHDNSDNLSVFLGILGCEIRWNAWLEQAEIKGHEWSDWTFVDDAVVALLRTRGNRTKTRFRPTKEFFWDTLLAIARANTFDPAVDRLDALAATWDGTPRLSIWLSRACGTPCDIYHQAVARNIVGGMVRRIREPGCKHDLMPIFFGFQGSGKSTMARILAFESDWFTDEVMLGDASKELVLSLAGKSVVEVSEMGMRSGADASHIKAMVSRQVDRGRTAYARSVSARPRRNVFIGTTNEDEPLRDPTGNRRFLPVRVDREIDLEWLADNVSQIVGEAARLHSQGESFDLPRSVWGIAAEHQEAARSASDLEIQLHAWFGETPFTPIAFVTAEDLVKACRVAGLRDGTRRAGIMRQLGFRQEKPYIDGKRALIWYRGPKDIEPRNIERKAVRYRVGSDARNGEVIVRVTQ